jgi:hypothetical protein
MTNIVTDYNGTTTSEGGGLWFFDSTHETFPYLLYFFPDGFDSPITGDGVLFLLNFTVSSSASGSYTIGLANEYQANLQRELLLGTDFENEIAATVVQGNVTVVDTSAPAFAATPSTDEPTVGEPFTVDVKLTAAAGTTFAPANLNVSFDADKFEYSGTNATAADGVTVGGANGGAINITRSGATVTIGDSGEYVFATLQFTPKAGTATQSGAFAVTSAKYGTQGNPTDDGLTVASGDALGSASVTIQAVNVNPVVNFVSDYKGAPSGYQLLKYTTGADGANGFKYDGEPLYWSAKLNAWLYIVPSPVDETAALLKIAAGSSPADRKTVAYSGDVNGANNVTIIDSQIAYDLATSYSTYSDDTPFAELSVLARLEADVNGDGDVDVADARAIQASLHNGGTIPTQG